MTQSEPALRPERLPEDTDRALRPQGQDIIRTWLFSTVVRAHHLQDSLPWKQHGSASDTVPSGYAGYAPASAAAEKRH